MDFRVLVAFALVVTPGLALAKDVTMPMHHQAAATTPAEKANKAAMDRMMTSMAAKPTGDADSDFVTMMLPHHQGAIDMAKVELQYGKDPQLLDLARGVVAAQEKEIAEMKDWIAKHGK